MPESFAHICSRADASSRVRKIERNWCVKYRIKPRVHGEKIAIPITKGEMKLEFDEVQRINPHSLLSKLVKKTLQKNGEKLGKNGHFPNGTNTDNWPMEEIATALNATKIGIQNEVHPGVTRKSQLNLFTERIHGYTQRKFR